MRVWIKQADNIAKYREEKTATTEGKAHDDGFKPLEL
jgi:hypothetical protein